jgi:hypothetical protein
MAMKMEKIKDIAKKYVKSLKLYNYNIYGENFKKIDITLPDFPPQEFFDLLQDETDKVYDDELGVLTMAVEEEIYEVMDDIRDKYKEFLAVTIAKLVTLSEDHYENKLIISAEELSKGDGHIIKISFNDKDKFYQDIISIRYSPVQLLRSVQTDLVFNPFKDSTPALIADVRKLLNIEIIK